MNFLVTAGPTRERLDPVRYLSNRSSGKMGYAVARAAKARGHETILITGPVVLDRPKGVRCVDVVSAEEMHAAVGAHLTWCNVLIMAAAVADWRPRYPSEQKLKKSAMSESIRIEPVPDILSSMAKRKGDRYFVGFAAETEDLVQEAERKLTVKQLDLVVGNDVSRSDVGFESDSNEVVLIDQNKEVDVWPRMTKDEIARRLILRIESCCRLS